VIFINISKYYLSPTDLHKVAPIKVRPCECGQVFLL
jgi:hypothetical protein